MKIWGLLLLLLVEVCGLRGAQPCCGDNFAGLLGWGSVALSGRHGRGGRGKGNFFKASETPVLTSVVLKKEFAISSSAQL